MQSFDVVMGIQKIVKIDRNIWYTKQKKKNRYNSLYQIYNPYIQYLQYFYILNSSTNLQKMDTLSIISSGPRSTSFSAICCCCCDCIKIWIMNFLRSIRIIIIFISSPPLSFSSSSNPIIAIIIQYRLS